MYNEMKINIIKWENDVWFGVYFILYIFTN